MIVKNYCAPNIKDEYRQLDLNKQAFLRFNLAGKSALSQTPAFLLEKSDVQFEGVVEDVTCVEGKLYCLFNTDFFVQRLDGKVFAPVCSKQFRAMPTIIPVISNGQEALLFCSKEGSCLVNSSGEHYLDFAIDNARVINNTLFCYEHKKIYFSKPLEVYDFPADFEFEGYIEIKDSNAGKVCGILPIGKDAYVFCLNKIFKLETAYDQSGYTITEVQTDSLQISSLSLQSLGGKVFFTSFGKLFLFDGKKVERQQSPLLDNFIITRSCVYQNYYLMIVRIGNVHRLYVRSADGEIDYFTDTLYVTSNGGYVVNQEEGQVLKFQDSKTKEKDFKWQSFPLDFGVTKIKNLTGVTIDCSVPVTLVISGDFGMQRYYLPSGANRVHCNLLSREYTIELSGRAKTYQLNKISLNYRIGEN